MNPQLSNYIRFFQVLGELETAQQITQKEKQQLKVSLTLKDPTLLNTIALNMDADNEEFKYSILNHLNEKLKTNKLTISVPKKPRSQSQQFEISPVKLRQRKSSVEKKVEGITDEDFNQQLDVLNESIITLLQQNKKQVIAISSYKTFQISQNQDKLKNLNKLIQKSIVTVDDDCYIPELVENMANYYKQIKNHFTTYMQSHLLLLDEKLSYISLYKFLRILTSQLVGCDNFSFFQKKENTLELYQSNFDSFSTVELSTELIDQLNLVQNDVVTELIKDNYYPPIAQLVNNQNYQRSFLIKTNEDTYCVFHQNLKNKVIDDFLLLTNEYYFTEEVKQLSEFLIVTVRQARVQIFSPLSISTMVQEIGISFLRCSKYLIIEKYIKLIRENNYKIEKLIYNALTEHQSPIQQTTQNRLTFSLEDSNSIYITMFGMDLNKKQDFSLYRQFQQQYNKYLKFVNNCFNRTAYHKFFLKSGESIIFEFDKKGQLTFLSKCIPQNLLQLSLYFIYKSRQKYQITFDMNMVQKGEATYTKIFNNNKNVIKLIENHLQETDKWKLNDIESDAEYEVFMKVEEKKFKGFAVVFQESWVKNQIKQLSKDNLEFSVEKSLRNTLIQQRTINYINKLEASNPEVMNTVISMFIPNDVKYPSSTRSSDTAHKQRKSFVEKLPIPISPFIQDEQLTIESFVVQDTDNQLDRFDFNILALTQVTNKIEKQRIVYSILKRNKFIERYRIPLSKLQEFLISIQKKYDQRHNKFHNYSHGVAVMQCTNYILTQTNLIKEFQRFALIVSALCHDVAHTGRTNIFEMNSLSRLALRYHDRSVLEQHHVAVSMKILTRDQSNILQNLSDEEFREFRKLMISNIFFTDISEHFKLLKEFEAKEKEIENGEEDFKLLCGLIIHSADFGGAAKRFEISRQWSERVNKEFEEQYLIEGQQGLPQQPYMKDLDKLNIMAKAEMGFLKFIVRPLYGALSVFLGDRLKECVDNLDENIIEWEKIYTKAIS